MSGSIKKLLCKYCSENNDHKTVTAGSIIDFIGKIIILSFLSITGVAFAFMMTAIAINKQNSTFEEMVISVLTLWVTLIFIILCIISALWLYVKSHEVEITKCERDD